MFGLSLTKVMVLICLLFFVFGVPLMGVLVTIKEKRDRRRREGD